MDGIVGRGMIYSSDDRRGGWIVTSYDDSITLRIVGTIVLDDIRCTIRFNYYGPKSVPMFMIQCGEDVDDMDMKHSNAMVRLPSN